MVIGRWSTYEASNASPPASIGSVLEAIAFLFVAFSAFSVLLYYAVTNAAALRLDPEQRRFPRWTAWAGLASCAFLSVWLDPQVVLISLGVIGVGIGWRAAWRQRART